MRLALIADSSAAYVDFLKEQIADDWGLDYTNNQKVHTISQITFNTLFGDSPLNIIELRDAEQHKTLMKELEEITSETKDGINENGLIITTSFDKRKTKKIESIITNLGGELFVSGASDNLKTAEKLVGYLNLNDNVKKFLLDYSGEDYDVLIPLVKSLSKLPPNTHKKVTVEDIYVRLPTPPGAVKPWTIEKPLFDGKIAETIDISRRINTHSSYLVWLSIVKKKIETYYRVSILMKERKTKDEIVSMLSLNKRSYFFVEKETKRRSVETYRKALDLIVNAEAELKGRSSAPAIALAEKLLVELCLLLKDNRG